MLWKLTKQRAHVLLKKAGLTPDENHRYDTAAAMRFRAAQVSEQEARVFFKGYNAHPLPKVLDHLAGDDDEEIDPLDCTPSVPKAASTAEALTEATRRHAALTELRAQEIEQRLQRQRMNFAREDGRLIERADVQRVGLEAGTAIMSIISTLAVEIVEIFSDDDTRDDVRKHCDKAVKRCQAALFRKMSDMMGENDVLSVDDDDDDEDEEVGEDDDI